MEKEKILEAYNKYHNSEYLGIDPLIVVHRFKGKANFDEIALFSALLSYGRVQQIIIAIEKMLDITNNISDKFLTLDIDKKRELLQNFKYRFHIGDDFAILFEIFKKVRETNGTLRNWAKKLWNSSSSNVEFINNFTLFFKNRGKEFSCHRNYFDWLFPSPKDGSPCKRIVMFLRWMVRDDDIDFGVWDFIPTSELFIPVDTHVAKIGKEYKLTTRKNASWKMSEEITNNLKELDSNDPTKFDFSLCRVGMVE